LEWCEWNKNRYPELELLYAIPNGSYKSKASAAKFKREGLKSGVPDLCLPVPRGNYGALYIEMKAKGGRPTKNQIDWMTRLEMAGNRVHLCFGFEEARKAILLYLRA
jgi:hypothetical protein